VASGQHADAGNHRRKLENFSIAMSILSILLVSFEGSTPRMDDHLDRLGSRRAKDRQSKAVSRMITFRFLKDLAQKNQWSAFGRIPFPVSR
jgi:hypothetical protein